MNDPVKKYKACSTIKTIEAYNCGLNNIDIVSNFPKISELNISYNPEVTSLNSI